MEQSGHSLPPTPSQQTPTQNQPTGGNLPNNQPVATRGVAGAGGTDIPPVPKIRKQRKPNANGPRRTSSAWDHFTKLLDGEAKDPTVACNYCKKKYLCDSKTHGTSNLLAHLKTCPKYTYAISHDPTQSVIAFKSGEGNDMVAANQRFNVTACRKALVIFVILDEQSFRVVDGEGFKYLCRQLQPQFTLPSRQTVTRDCFQLYLDEKLRLRNLFKSNSSRVALTTDCWTSIQNLSYLTLTAHFIDTDWNYQKRIISFSIVPNHKGEIIGGKVDEVLRDWGLRNISTITVDNASSNDVVVAHLRTRLNMVFGLVLEGQFFHMRCCAHILNLIVNDGLKDMHNSIACIQNAIRFVRSSPQRHDKFKECAEFARITCKKKVCLDVPTRWNSTYLMLETAEKFQVAFEMFGGVDTSYCSYFTGMAGPPTSNDWDNARCFIKFLKIFFYATLVFSASTHVSIHNAFHQLASIFCELRELSLNMNSILGAMGWEMKKKFDKYWGNVLNLNQLIYFGVILDPRYKLRYVEWSFKDMYFNDPIKLEKFSNSVQQNLFRMYAFYASTHEGGIGISRSETSSSDLGGVSRSETYVPSESQTHMARRDAFKQHLRDKNSIDQKNELERYLAEACVDGDDKFDILFWWKNNSSRFPILSRMVRDVMATPISTVASESAFSTGGRVLDAFRSSLSPEMTEALICSQSWLRPSLVQPKELNNCIEEFETSEDIVTEFQQLTALDVAVADFAATSAGHG